MEGDLHAQNQTDRILHFNPLPPHGGRREIVCKDHLRLHFNPLPPHGGRPYAPRLRVCAGLFQSTPSAWRETCDLVLFAPLYISFQSTPSAWRETVFLERCESVSDISIHSLRMEGDGMFSTYEIDNDLFQSTPSAWRETAFSL